MINRTMFILTLKKEKVAWRNGKGKGEKSQEAIKGKILSHEIRKCEKSVLDGACSCRWQYPCI